MAALAKLLLGVERRTTEAALLVATVCLALLTVISLLQVLSRFVLHQPLPWSEPACRQLMIWAVFMALPAAFRYGAMISVDILPSIVGPRTPWLLIVLTTATLVLLGMNAWYGIAILPRVRFQIVAGLGVSIRWAYLAIPMGSALAMLAVVADVISPKDDRTDGPGEGQL